VSPKEAKNTGKNWDLTKKKSLQNTDFLKNLDFLLAISLVLKYRPNKNSKNADYQSYPAILLISSKKLIRLIKPISISV
jgi:hypothetical protein